jgi:hypothetical protein
MARKEDEEFMRQQLEQQRLNAQAFIDAAKSAGFSQSQAEFLLEHGMVAQK